MSNNTQPTRSHVAAIMRDHIERHKDFRKNIVVCLTVHEAWLIGQVLDAGQFAYTPEAITRRFTRDNQSALADKEVE